MNAALGLVYPEWCVLCDSSPALRSDGYVCKNCQEGVQWIEEPLCSKCGRPYPGRISVEFVCHQCHELRPVYLRARSAALAKGVVLDAIHRFKYNRCLYLGTFLGRLLANRAAAQITLERWDAIVPVPLHWRKQWTRGFNQADRLARLLSRDTGLPVNKRLLRRIAHSKSQTRLTREERLKNVHGIFRASRRDAARGLRLIVVDDVMTTGATVNSCAKALLDAGAQSVCVWTAARGS